MPLSNTRGPARLPSLLAALRALLAMGLVLVLCPGPGAQAAAQPPSQTEAVSAQRGEAAPWRRPLSASTPSIGLSVPAQVPVGQNVSFSVTFDNGDASDAGYGPILDVVLDTTGADAGAGGGPFDGLGTTSITATYLGIPFSTSGPNPTMWILTFDASGEAVHPLMRDASGAYITVNGTPGDTLVVLRLPFGSFAPDQPAAMVAMTVNMSTFADVGTPLSIQARGGYQFGYNPLDDWCCGDPGNVTLSGFTSATVAPTLVTLTKTYAGPEDETATGPNFRTFYPLQYTVTATIAPGQSLTALTLQDMLSSNVQFHSLSPVGATCTLPAATPGGSISCSFPGPVSGSVSLVFDFYIPRDDAGGSRVLNAQTGDDATSCDNASLTAAWTPLDPRDTGGPVTVNPGGCEHTLTDKSIAVQKSVVNLSGANAPGALLEYTLRFQVSDFFAFQGVTLTDVISDGQHVEGTPTLEVEGNGFSLPELGMAVVNYDVTCDYTGGPGPECTIDNSGLPNSGDTTLTFRVSNELMSRGRPNGSWVGGCVHPAGGSADPDCDPANPGGYNDGPTHATLRFRARILNAFTDDFPSGDPSVDQGDVLGDTVGIVGDLLNTGTLAATGFNESDASSAGLSIGTGSLSKSVYAVNGGAPGDPVLVKPGDEVTYRITYALPISDVENLEFNDYLPLPVFHVGDPDEVPPAGPAWSFDPTVSAAEPPAGVAKFGPADTFYAYTCSSLGPPATGTPPGCLLPTLTSDATNNRLRFYYGDFNDSRHQGTTVDLLFTLVVSDDPFADQLYLTNQVNGFEGSTNAGTVASDAIRQIVLTEPVLRTTKGVIWTSNANSAFDPEPAGPVTFLAPASAPRWSGVINSANVAATPIDSNVGGVDAGDIVTFAIAVENTGSSLKGAFDIVLRDDLPAPYQIPAGGLNLQIFYGNGTGDGEPLDPSINYTRPDDTPAAPADLFTTGIKLVDPVGQGVCQAHDPNLGNNIILITYDLQLGDATAAGTVINTASLVNYAGSEGGPNHLPEPQTDTAETTIAGTAAKALVGTEIDNAVNGSAQAVIGELVTYRLTLTVPEGVTPDARIVDTLDPGLAFVRVDSVTLSTDLTAENAIGTGATPAYVTIGGSGGTITLNPGDLTNANRDNAQAETVEIFYTAVVLNVSGNQGGTLLNNSAVHSWEGGSLPAASASDVTVIEPVLAVDKSAVVNGLGTSGDAGDPIVYTITLQHASTSATDAFDVMLSDDLPQAAGGESLIAGAALTSVVDSDGILGPADFTFTGNDAAGYTLSTVAPFDLPLDPPNPPFRMITFTITGTLAIYVEPGTFSNTAAGTWTSLDGLPGVRSTYNPSSTERTGAYPVVQPNDYSDTGVAAVNVETSPDKLIVATSEAHTALDSGRERLAIGEIVRYRLTAVLPEGTSTNLQIVDLLPQGLLLLDPDEVRLSFAADDDISEAADLAGADNDAVPPTFMLPADRIAAVMVSGRQRLTLGLGNLVNNDDDLDAELITLEFNALVDNSLAGGNDAGDTRDNAFTVWVGGIQVASSNTVLAGIVEPAITNLVKVTVPPAPQDAGDTVALRITYSNPAGMPRTTAFESRLTDTLNANLVLNLASISVTLGGGAAGITDDSSGNTVDVTVASVPAGGSVQVDFTATVIDDVLAGAVIPNDAALTYTSLPGPYGTLVNPTGSETPGATGAANGERGGTIPIVQPNDYSDTASASIDLTGPVIAKQAPLPAQQTIGGEVDYDLLVTLPEGATTNLRVRDALPAGLAYLSHSVITTAAGSGGLLAADYIGTLTPTPACPACAVGASGVTLEFQFGDVQTDGSGPANGTGANQFVVQVRARVLNVAGNQNGTPLTNTASLAYVNPQTGDSSVPGGSRALAVTEPELQVVKVVDDDTPGFGQEITYRITVSHAAGSTADAYDLSLSDLVPAGLTYVAGSLGNESGVPAVLSDSGAPTLSATWPTLPLGQSSVIHYRATVAGVGSVDIGDVLTNAVALTWTSLSGPSADERTGSGGVNDYRTTTSTPVTVTGPDLRVLKDDGRVAASPGDTLTYTVTVTNDGNSTAPNVLLTDTIPAHTTFQSASGGGVFAAGAVTWPAFDLADSASTFRTVTVRVDNPVPAGVVSITNIAEARDDGTAGPDPTPDNNTDTDVDTLDAGPDLVITKDDGVDIVSPGSLLVYAIRHDNVGDQDATGAVVTETVPDETTFDASASLPTIWSCPDGSTGGTICTFTLGNLAAGTGGNLTFAVRVDDPVALGTTQIVDTVSISDDGTNGPEPTPSDNTYTDTDNLVTLPNADLSKSLVATNQAHTITPAAAIGEILTYELVLTIPQGTMTSATLTDVLDLGLAFETCQDPVATGGLTTSLLPGGFTEVCDLPANPTVAAEPPGGGADQGRRLTFDLGTLTNPGPESATLTLRYTAVVIDNPDNVRGVNLNNRVTWNWIGGQLVESASEVVLVEPTLTLEKDADPRSVPPGGVVTFTLTVRNDAPPSDSPAFDLELTDSVPSGMTYVPGSLTASGGGVVDDTAAPALSVTWPVLGLNETVSVSFQATMGALPAGTRIRNDGYLAWSTLPGDVSAPQSPFNLLSTERVYDPPINANVEVGIPSLPETGFAPGRLTQLEGESRLADMGKLALEIPALQISIPIVGVPAEEAGWDLTWLGAQVGYLEGTAYPTHRGNSALTAHVTLPDGRPGPFADLSDLRWGDRVVVHAYGLGYIYEVRSVARVNAVDLRPLGHKDKAWLTLITCRAYSEASGRYLHRIIVQAVLVEVAED